MTLVGGKDISGGARDGVDRFLVLVDQPGELHVVLGLGAAQELVLEDPGNEGRQDVDLGSSGVSRCAEPLGRHRLEEVLDFFLAPAQGFGHLRGGEKPLGRATAAAASSGVKSALAIS